LNYLAGLAGESISLTFTSITADPELAVMFFLIDSPILLLKYEMFLVLLRGYDSIGNSGEFPRVTSTYSLELFLSEKETD
jgi:hypothetical protein